MSPRLSIKDRANKKLSKKGTVPRTSGRAERPGAPATGATLGLVILLGAITIYAVNWIFSTLSWLADRSLNAAAVSGEYVLVAAVVGLLALVVLAFRSYQSRALACVQLGLSFASLGVTYSRTSGIPLVISLATAAFGIADGYNRLRTAPEKK